MKVKIDIKNCKHISVKSTYNNNYYLLPFEVNGCNTLFNYYDGSESFIENSIGVISEDKYIVKYYLHTDGENEDQFIFDSEEISGISKWKSY